MDECIPEALSQNESLCETFHIKNEFDYHEMNL